MAHLLRDQEALGQPLRPRCEPLLPATRPAPHSEPAAALLDHLANGFVALDTRGRIT